MGTRRLAVFLDYDGTLVPIAERPELAIMSDEMRRTIALLAAKCPVAIISGRGREDVKNLVGLGNVIYAGSHGLDLDLPGNMARPPTPGAAFVPAIQRAAEALNTRLADEPGVLIENKTYTLAVHYRLASPSSFRRIAAIVDAVLLAEPTLHRTGGKMVHELRPKLDWDKGKALLWLSDALGLVGPHVLPIYVGDDITDEDAFGVLAERGVGILVAGSDVPTRARYRLSDPSQVQQFLEGLTQLLDQGGG